MNSLIQSVRSGDVATRPRFLALGLRTLLVLFGVAFVVSYGYGLIAGLAGGDFGSGLSVVPVIVVVPLVLGLLIDRKHPGHRIALLFLVMAYSSAVTTIVSALGALNESRVALFSPAVHDVLQVLGHTMWLPGVFIPLFIMPMVFPTGKLLSTRWRVVVLVVVLCMAWMAIAIAVHPWPWPGSGISDTRTFNGIAGSEPLIEAVSAFFNGLLTAAALLVILSVILRFRRTQGVERQQMKWPIVAVAGVIVLSIVKPIVPGVDALDQEADFFLTWTLAMLFPVSIGVAILWHRLWDIDIIISRTLIYGSLTVLIVAIYVAVVSGLGLLFQTQTNVVSGLIAAGIVAVLFQPLRNSLQQSVNRLLYGQRDDPAAVLTQLAHNFEAAETLDASLHSLVETIARTLKVPYTAIWLPPTDGQMEPAAVWGIEPDNVLEIPVSYQQETIGRLVVAPRGPGEKFTAKEEKLLSAIAALAATTIHAVGLSEELRRSRQRIVNAREDERRRLRRDLHDGLGPQLASQTLGLEAVAQLVDHDPDKAQALLDILKLQAEEATTDVRRLVYDLRPPALDDLGLIGALQQSAARYETGNLTFVFDVPATLPNLPAAVETAVYRISQEAMTNVVRHSEATICRLRLACDHDYCMVEISDNGRGLATNHGTGVGLQAMHERVAELDGILALGSSAAGGVLVRASFPLGVSSG